MNIFNFGNQKDNRYNGYGGCQKLKQIQKIDQKQIQLQDQNNSNKLLMILLSSAENFAAKLYKDIKREYSSHDFGHSFESKNINKILLQFIEQIEIFESSYKRFCKVYSCEYIFPYDPKTKKGLSKAEIIKDLQYWKNCVDSKYKKYYIAIIDLLNGKPIPDFSEDFENLSGINDLGKDNKCNPKELRDIYPILLAQSSDENKQIEEDYQNNKDLMIIIDKNEKNKNYIYESKINEKLNKNKENSINLDKIKIEIKYSPISQFDGFINDLPNFVINALKPYNFSANVYKDLKVWISSSKKDEILYDIISHFFHNFNLSPNNIDKIVEFVCNKIYEELYDPK